MPKQNGNIILVKKRKLSLPSFKKNEAMWYLYGISEALCLLLWCTSTAHPRTAWWDIFDSAQYSRICFFWKNVPLSGSKAKIFFNFFVKWSQLHYRDWDFSSSQKHLILAYGYYCTGFPILVHCVVCSLALRKISFVSKKWLSS